MDTKKTVTLADWRPTERQITLVTKVLSSGRLTYGAYTRELEKKFAQKHGRKYAIFMNSGTSALHIAWHYYKLKYGWKDGSEVLVPAVTFAATVNVLLHNRLTPILVDVKTNGNMDPEHIERHITKKTVAICPVDLLGVPCAMEKIRTIARSHGLRIIEDSCETMFVRHQNGLPVGSLADIACYSSYLAHIISTGVGGFLCTNNKKDADYMRSMIWHGRDNLYLSIDDNVRVPIEKLIKKRFLFNKPGYSFRLTELEAAIGIDEIDRSKTIIEKRQEHAQDLRQSLLPLQGYIQLPSAYPDNAWMFFPIIVLKGNRDRCMIYLEKKGIQTRTMMPLTRQPVFKGLWNPNDYPTADWINRRGILIGIHHFLSNDDLAYIARCFREYYDTTT